VRDEEKKTKLNDVEETRHNGNVITREFCSKKRREEKSNVISIGETLLIN